MHPAGRQRQPATEPRQNRTRTEVTTGVPLDETVVADIHRDHAAVLRRFVGRAAMDPARIEDVVQEVIQRVWRQAPEVSSMRANLKDHAARAAEPDEHEHYEEPLGRIGESVGRNLACPDRGRSALPLLHPAPIPAE
jgi:hypothetical protein